MRRATLASIRAHIPRLVAVSLAIVLAVAFMSATLILNSSIKATLRESVGQQYAKADLVLVADPSYGGAISVSPAVQKKIMAVDGVADLYVPLSSTATLVRAEGEVSVPVESLAPEHFRSTTLASGEFPTTATEAVIDQTTATQYGFAVGDKVTVRSDKYSENGDSTTTNTNVTIVGISNPSKNPAAYSTGGLTVTSGFFTATDSSVSSGLAQVSLAAGADRAAVAASIDTALEADAASAGSSEGASASEDATATHDVTSGVAITPDDYVALIVRQMTGGADLLTAVLLVFVGIALLVCGLVIANTFAVLVSQRARELALLRCLGADAKQIYRSVIVEALVVAAVASVAGVLVAIGLMSGLLAVFGPSLGSAGDLAVVSVDANAVIWPIVAGIVVTVIAAGGPARQATRVAPLQAMRPVDALEEGVRAGKGRFVAGLVLTILGGLLLLVSSVLPAVLWPEGTGSGAVLGFFGAFVGSAVSVVGVIMLAVFYVPAVLRGIAVLVGRLFGIPGRLATLNSIRNPRRTAATATALIIGVGLVATILTAGQVARASLISELGEKAPIDLIAQVGYDQQTSGVLSATQADVSQVLAVDGVQAATVVQIDSADFSVPGKGRQYVQLFGLSSADYAKVARTDAGNALTDGVGLTSKEYAGSTLTVTSSDGTKKLKVVAKQGGAAGVLVLTPNDFAAVATSSTFSGVAIKLRDGLTPAEISSTANKIQALFPQGNVSGSALERAVYEQIIDTLLLIVTGLLAVAIVIALIGVSNTLSLSVIERTRENAMLRALGLTRGQLRGMLATEAILMAGIAAVIGTTLGILYGVLGALSLFNAEGGVVVSIPWMSLLAVVGVAVLAGLIASVGPARRAARLSPIEGLATT